MIKIIHFLKHRRVLLASGILSLIFLNSSSVLTFSKESEAILPTSAEQVSITPPNAPSLASPKMKWAPSNKAKDPSVVYFDASFFLYFSVPPQVIDGKSYGWTIGVAESKDLVDWEYVKNILPEQNCTQQGLCAPCAKVFDEKVFLFYQTYGNGSKDAICISSSCDGINFTHNPNNPIFRPHGDWTNGRAIDADVVNFKGKTFLYAATRGTNGQIQKLTVASTALLPKDFMTSRPEDWIQSADYSILEPELPWETKCIEAPSVIARGDKLYMFYAGGFNNDPQHVGVAVSDDGIAWKRLWNVPFITNGPSGQWNASESGHPGIFQDPNGQTWLFFQGNNTHGKDWYLSRVKIDWNSTQDVDVPAVVNE